MVTIPRWPLQDYLCVNYSSWPLNDPAAFGNFLGNERAGYDGSRLDSMG